jgi:hypothetical protein
MIAFAVLVIERILGPSITKTRVEPLSISEVRSSNQINERNQDKNGRIDFIRIHISEGLRNAEWGVMVRLRSNKIGQTGRWLLNPFANSGNPYLNNLQGAPRFVIPKSTRCCISYPENVWRNE